MNKINICKSFNTQVYENHIPVNAVYGKISKTVYFFVTDFKQFNTRKNTWCVYIMDTKKGSKFIPQYQKVGNKLYDEILTYIHASKISPDTVCKNHHGHYARPERKKSQFETGFTYKTTGNPVAKSNFEKNCTTDYPCSNKQPYAPLPLLRPNSGKTADAVGMYHEHKYRMVRMREKCSK